LGTVVFWDEATGRVLALALVSAVLARAVLVEPSLLVELGVRLGMYSRTRLY